MKHSLPGLSDYEDVLLDEKLRRNVLDTFKNSLFRSEANVFWSQLEIDGCIPEELSIIISDLHYEQARVVMLFLGNMLRWSAMTHPSEVCFLCPAKSYSTHYFSCRQFQTSSALRDFSSILAKKDYKSLIECIFVTLKEWMVAYPAKFNFRFCWNISSYFDAGMSA